MGGSSKSSRKQNTEGDIVFNNVDYGGQGSGAGPLKNFNVGRENTLEGNIFNVTDGGATRNALAAGVAMANSANDTVRKGAAYALGSNEAVSKTAINNNTATAFKGLDTAVDLAKINQQVSDGAIDAVTGTTSEAIKASKQAQELAAKQARESAAAAAKQAKESASQAFSFAKSSNKELADFAGRSNREAFDLSREAIGTYEDLVDKTGEKVTEAQVTSANATGKALDYVFQSSKSATERSSENLIKYGTWGAVGVVGVISLTALLRR